MQLALAVDVGGTKMAAGLVTAEGELVTSATSPTPRDADAETLFSVVLALCDSVGGDGDVVACGVGCGGPMTRGGEEVSPLNIPGWRRFPLRSRLADATGLPTFVDNDAKALALGEGWRGAAAGVDNFIAMVVSTGVGGGIVVDGRLLDGASGNAGHIGHVVVEPAGGPLCTCGARGCLEAVARGPALVAWAQREGWRQGQPDATAKDLADDGAQGHPVGVAAMRRAGRALGIAIASATYLCDLEVVSIGGGLSQAGHILFDPLEETLHAHAKLPFVRQLTVVPAALGQNAGLVGAAALIFAADRYWTGD